MSARFLSESHNCSRMYPLNSHSGKSEIAAMVRWPLCVMIRSEHGFRAVEEVRRANIRIEELRTECESMSLYSNKREFKPCLPREDDELKCNVPNCAPKIDSRASISVS